MPKAKRIFFQEFLKAPRSVASMIPSSSFLERRVLRASELTQAHVVVELGAGTGGITRALLTMLPTNARLLAIEANREFVENLQAADDPRLQVVLDCASSITRHLQEQELGAADAVVSGIPFSTMPNALCTDIINGIVESLRPGGRFVAYQFTERVAHYARPVLGEPAVEHELRNIPPLRVFTWRKVQPAKAGTGNSVLQA